MKTPFGLKNDKRRYEICSRLTNNTADFIGLPYFSYRGELRSERNVSIKISADAQIGDLIEFGEFPADSDGGLRPIQWRILDRKDDRILANSELALTTIPYNNEWEVTNWEHCDLRKWLNVIFYNNAFSAEEKELICSSVIDNKDPYWDTDGGADTLDKVFLLSAEEVLKYFPDNASRVKKASDYALEQGPFKSKDKAVWWWLRSSVSRCAYAAYGGIANINRHCACPAIWISTLK